ncbi:MAG: hypothetical protein HGA98_05160 [Deltaproteobacteria bacterium]|nr:hypothetical protein [Deltaproteobacteria bacterium]
MAAIDLTEGEVNLLKELLHGDRARLLLEIAHTDHRAMRDGLKEREAVLEALAAKLG